MEHPGPINDDSSVSLGDQLRRRRQQQGIELSEISESTRIGIRFLRAIEDNDFEALPGGLFTRSFIRSYARYVGMDEEAALRLYFQQVGSDEQEPHPLASSPVQSASRSSREANVIIAIAVLIVLAIGGVAGWHYWQRLASGGPTPVETPPTPDRTPQEQTRSASPPPAEAVNAPPQPLPEASKQSALLEVSPAATAAPPVQSRDLAPLAKQPSEPAPTDMGHTLAVTPDLAPEPPTSLARLRMNVLALGNCWISVKTDAAKDHRLILKQGETRSFTAHDQLVISAQDASQLSIIINGYLIRLPQPQTPEGVTITPQNLLQFVKP